MILTSKVWLLDEAYGNNGTNGLDARRMPRACYIYVLFNRFSPALSRFLEFKIRSGIIFFPPRKRVNCRIFPMNFVT